MSCFPIHNNVTFSNFRQFQKCVFNFLLKLRGWEICKNSRLTIDIFDLTCFHFFYRKNEWNKQNMIQNVNHGKIFLQIFGHVDSINLPVVSEGHPRVIHNPPHVVYNKSERACRSSGVAYLLRATHTYEN
jgi:hypothetical protein